MNETTKHKRGGNFSTEEEQLLLRLIDQYKNIIENKKSGVVSWKDKEATWKKVEEEFNCRNSKLTYRNVKNLKEKYANLKRNAKKKFSINRQNIIKTGGGSSEPISFTEVDLTIKEILGEQIDGLTNTYDDDATSSIYLKEELTISLFCLFQGLLQIPNKTRTPYQVFH